MGEKGWEITRIGKEIRAVMEIKARPGVGGQEKTYKIGAKDPLLLVKTFERLVGKFIANGIIKWRVLTWVMAKARV